MNLTFARFGRLVRLSAAALALMTVVACKPSVEGETRTWESNRLTLQEWVGKFPNFKPAIDGRMAEAQADFDAAKAIGDADERAAKMREANNKLSTLTSAFQEIDRKIREFETLKNDQQLLRLPGTILMPAMNASQAMLADARRRLDGPVNNAGEAIGRLRDASQGIERAMAPLRQARAQVQQQNQQGRPGQPGQPGMGQPPGQMQPGQMQGGMGQPGGMPGQQPMGMARPMGGPGMGAPGMAAPGLAPQGQMPPQGVQGMGGQMAPGVAPGAGAPPPGVMPQGTAPGGAPPAAGGAKPF